MPEFPKPGEVLSKPPHRVVDAILSNIISLPKGVSENISSTLDSGPLGNAGPHRMIDSVIKGIVDSINTFGKSISNALDTPTKVVSK